MTTPSLTAPTILRLHTPTWLRAWHLLRSSWLAARSERAERRLIRQLLRETNGLDDATRRDLGLPELGGLMANESSVWSGAWPGRW